MQHIYNRLGKLVDSMLLQVATLKTGEIDCSDLKVHLLRNKGLPAILNVNIGTTVKGAVDDLDQVCSPCLMHCRLALLAADLQGCCGLLLLLLLRICSIFAENCI